ncbi:MAG: hypothetical protein AB2989_06605 [Candidatus Symbiodolus clandestinus]
MSSDYCQVTIQPNILPNWAQGIGAYNQAITDLSSCCQGSRIAVAPASLSLPAASPFPVPPRPPEAIRHRHHRTREQSSVHRQKLYPAYTSSLPGNPDPRHRYRSMPDKSSTLYAWVQSNLSAATTATKEVVNSENFKQFKQDMTRVGGCAATVGTGIATGAVTQMLAKGEQNFQTAQDWAREQLSYYYPTTHTIGQKILNQATLLAAGAVGASWGALSGLAIGAFLGMQEGYQSYHVEQGTWASMKQAFFSARGANGATQTTSETRSRPFMRVDSICASEVSTRATDNSSLLASEDSTYAIDRNGLLGPSEIPHRFSL